MKLPLSTPMWSYLLGVIHGDGHVAQRSIAITVGYKDAEYAEILFNIFARLKLKPHIYRKRSALSVEVHSVALAQELARWKSNGIWKVPSVINAPNYLAGVFDTDGCVSKPHLKHVSIGLKRSGNLIHVLRLLERLDIKGLRIANSVSRYNGYLYPTETIKIGGMNRIIRFSNIIKLRNPRKAARMVEMRSHIKQRQSVVPRWKSVGIFCSRPRNWKDIATHFNLTKRQVDSTLGWLKRCYSVQVIPPESPLCKYLVNVQS